MATNGVEEFENDEDLIVKGWLLYMKGLTFTPFKPWLQRNLPSNVSKTRCRWIAVGTRFSSQNSDTEGLLKSWKMLQKSGRSVNYESIKEIACNHHVTAGKWLFFTDSGAKVDHLWSLVASAVVNNTGRKIPCNSAKVNTYNDSKSHVVCIYNDDFTNKEQVMDSERAIRNMGIKCKLQYKPDVFTHLNIYGSSNAYGKPEYQGLRPYILISNFDLKTGTSVITSLVEK